MMHAESQYKNIHVIIFQLIEKWMLSAPLIYVGTWNVLRKLRLWVELLSLAVTSRSPAISGIEFGLYMGRTPYNITRNNVI